MKHSSCWHCCCSSSLSSHLCALHSWQAWHSQSLFQKYQLAGRWSVPPECWHRRSGTDLGSERWARWHRPSQPQALCLQRQLHHHHFQLMKTSWKGSYKCCLAPVFRKIIFKLTQSSYLLKIVTYRQVLSVDGWVQQRSLLLMAQLDLTTKGHKDLMSRHHHYQYITMNQNILKDVIT